MHPSSTSSSTPIDLPGWDGPRRPDVADPAQRRKDAKVLGRPSSSGIAFLHGGGGAGKSCLLDVPHAQAPTLANLTSERSQVLVIDGLADLETQVPRELRERLSVAGARSVAEEIVRCFADHEEVRQLAIDMLEAGLKSLQNARFEPLASVVGDWSATADLYADDELCELVKERTNAAQDVTRERLDWETVKSLVGD